MKLKTNSSRMKLLSVCWLAFLLVADYSSTLAQFQLSKPSALPWLQERSAGVFTGGQGWPGRSPVRHPCSSVFFEDVGDLPGDCYYSLPTDISNDGKRVVLSSSADEPDIPNDGGTCDPWLGWPHSNEAAGWTRPCQGESFWPGQSEPGLVPFGYYAGEQSHSESLATAVSGDGKVVVGYSNYAPDNNVMACVFTPDGPRPLALLDNGCVARDVSNSRRQISGGFTEAKMRGRIIVGYSNLHNQYPIRLPGAKAVYWDNWTRIWELPLPGTLPNGMPVFSAEAVCISDDGRFIGGNLYYDELMNPLHHKSYGCVWEYVGGAPPQYALLGILEDAAGGDDNGNVRAISGDGRTLVGRGAIDEADPACWDVSTVALAWQVPGSGNSAMPPGAPVSLAGLPGFESGNANGASFDGSVIVGGAANILGTCAYPEFDVRPLRWEAHPGAGYSGPADISDLMADYLPEGWMLFDAIRVSGNGKTVTGYGMDYDYNIVGWVAGLPQGEPLSRPPMAEAVPGPATQAEAVVVLAQNVPNPASQGTQIEVSLLHAGTPAYLIVKDLVTSRVVMTIQLEEGDNRIGIDKGRLPPGRYIYTVVSGDHVAVPRQMIILE